MPDPQDRLTALEEQVVDLRTRLTALEKGQLPSVSSLPMMPPLQLGREPLQEKGALQGMLSFDGSVQFAERRLQWKESIALQPVFAASPELLAQIFAALSSPHRIIILRTLCERSCTSQQLQELLGMGSAGQLYHHLKELLAAGLILQRGRSAYTIEPTKVIPVCIALMVAFHLTTPDQRTQANVPPPDQQEEELPESN